MIQLKDGSGSAADMGYSDPGRVIGAKLTGKQIRWYSNVIGNWLVHCVGLSFRDASAVLSRKISERQLRDVIKAMSPVAALPDPNGFQNGWKLQFQTPAKIARPQARGKTRRPHRLPTRPPAGRGRIFTAPAKTSTAGSPKIVPG